MICFSRYCLFLKLKFWLERADWKFLRENTLLRSSDGFESLLLRRNVYILVSFHPAGSEGFEVRSHFTPVTTVSVLLRVKLHPAKDVQCLSAVIFCVSRCLRHLLGWNAPGC